jgi:hypothetical protein
LKTRAHGDSVEDAETSPDLSDPVSTIER